MSDENKQPPNKVLGETFARAATVSQVMNALGPEYERAGEQLADRIMKILDHYTADETVVTPHEAVGHAVAESVLLVLSLLAAAARGRRGE